MTTTRAFSLWFSIAAASFSHAAFAKVAVVVSTPDRDVWHREVAAGLVMEVERHWDVLSPPLSADDVGACRAEAACLRSVAAHRGAEWLLLCGVAGAGVRDVVVTLQLIGPDGVARLDDSAFVLGTADPRAEGRRLADRVLAVVGPNPAHRDGPSTQLPVVVDRAAMLVTGGAALVGVGIGVSAWMITMPSTRDAALPVVLTSGVIGIAAGATGVALVVLAPPGDALSTSASAAPTEVAAPRPGA